MLKSERNCTNCAMMASWGRFPPECRKCSHRWPSMWIERNCDNCLHDAKDPALLPCCDCKYGLGEAGSSILWMRKDSF
jgi:hypothetical protein